MSLNHVFSHSLYPAILCLWPDLWIVICKGSNNKPEGDRKLSIKKGGGGLKKHFHDHRDCPIKCWPMLKVNLTFLVWTSVALCTFTLLCIYHHPSPELFDLPQLGSPSPLNPNSPVPPTPGSHHSTFCPCDTGHILTVMPTLRIPWLQELFCCLFLKPIRKKCTAAGEGKNLQGPILRDWLCQ